MAVLFRLLGCLVILVPLVGGIGDELADKSTVSIAMAFACWAWAAALRKEARIEQLERFCRQLTKRGSNLKQGASVDDFRDVFR